MSTHVRSSVNDQPITEDVIKRKCHQQASIIYQVICPTGTGGNREHS